MFKAAVRWFRKRREISRVMKQMQRDVHYRMAMEEEIMGLEQTPSVLPLLSPREREELLSRLPKGFSTVYLRNLKVEKLLALEKQRTSISAQELQEFLKLEESLKEAHLKLLPRLWPALSPEEKRSFILSLPKDVLKWLLGLLPDEFVNQLLPEEPPF